MTVTNISEQRKRKGKRPEVTEIDLPRLFAEAYISKFAYRPGIGWYTKYKLTKGQWMEDIEGLGLVRMLRDYCSDWEFEGSSVVFRTKELLKAELVSEPDKWITHPEIAGLPCGKVIDLRTGEPRFSKAADRVTRRLGCDPDFTGEPETWLQTLDEVLPQDSIEFFQRFVGYCLTGYTREHVFLFAYGSGRNGKSTVLGTIEKLLGEYWRGIPHTGLAGSKHEQHSEWLARLDGARLVTGLELPENGSWNLPLLKSLVAGDNITSRHMRQSSFEFTPVCKIVVAGNHKPNLGRVDKAIEERLVLLPFVNTFDGKKVNRQLPDMLDAELPKIMAWAIEGVKKYLTDGLGGKPQTAKDAAEQYLMEQDRFGGWVDECLVIKAGAFAPSQDLIKDYNNYSGAHLGKVTPIAEYLTEKYGVYSKLKRHNGKPTRGLVGVGLVGGNTDEV